MRLLRIIPIGLCLIIVAFVFSACDKSNQPLLGSEAGDQESKTYPDGLTASSVSPEIAFNYGGKSVRVKVYSRDVGEAKNHPVFKLGDLIHRAIAYKNANPQEDVRIKFAVYRMGDQAYIGINPAHSSSYAYVRGHNFAPPHSVQLQHSIVEAALNEVSIDFVYHKDTSGDVFGYITGFMDEPCITDPNKQVKDYLRIKKVSWGEDAFQQMHAKFMTVSHYAGNDGSLYANTVYSTSANVDDHGTNGIPVSKDWVQSGILINEHPELMQSFNSYFDLIFDHAHNQGDFHSAVRQAHANGALNYDDQHFSSYFTPIPLEPEGHYTYIPETGDGDPSNGNAWDIEFNPVAKYVDQMASITTGNRYFKANVYHLKTDNFGQKLYNEMSNIYNDGTPGLKHFRWVVRTNSYDHVFPTTNFNNTGIIKYPRATHSKDLLFAFSGISEYYTLTGSANLKLDENVSKANATIVIKEYTTDHPVYNIFKDIYNYEYID